MPISRKYKTKLTLDILTHKLVDTRYFGIEVCGSLNEELNENR